MPLIFITGVSTAGKSTIARELVKRGYEAYDTEQNNFSAWYNRGTGERAAGFMEATRNRDWYKNHAWNMSISKVKELAAKAENKPIFLCGGSNNYIEVNELCDKIFWLIIDEPTIKQRITKKREHSWGTIPEELAMTLKTNKLLEKEYRKAGAYMIDSRLPLDAVIQKIIWSLD